MMVEQGLVDLTACTPVQHVLQHVCRSGRGRLLAYCTCPMTILFRNLTSAGLKSDGARLASVQLVSECCKLLLTKKQ